jgi:hypothetical protein
MEFDFSKRFTKARREEFAQQLLKMSAIIGMRVSTRGWGYLLEGERIINKNQIDRVADAINDCRRDGLLPVDFVAEEKARDFEGVEYPSDETMEQMLHRMLNDVLTGYNYYTPDWWEDEKYYIQCVVEKVDIMNLFGPICRLYHIPIANSKGWSSILQRAEYARRFAVAERMGLKCVLLYCGDHDPDGIRISDTLRKNLDEIKDVRWEDGADGYDPAELIIDRIGLSYEFIVENELTWIDNLITGRRKNGKPMDLSDPNHPNHFQQYVQHYLNNYGARKCEANAIMVNPAAARALIRESIEKYLGKNARARFEVKEDAPREEYLQLLRASDLEEPIINFLAKNNNNDE